MRNRWLESEELAASSAEISSGNSSGFSGSQEMADEVIFEVLATAVSDPEPSVEFQPQITFDSTNWYDSGPSVTVTGVGNTIVALRRTDHTLGKNARLKWIMSSGSLTFSVIGHTSS